MADHNFFDESATAIFSSQFLDYSFSSLCDKYQDLASYIPVQDLGQNDGFYTSSSSSLGRGSISTISSQDSGSGVGITLQAFEDPAPPIYGPSEKSDEPNAAFPNYNEWADQALMPAPKHGPKSLWTPSRLDWNKYKETILSLYNLFDLPKVMEEMKTRYGFNATVDMYKRRLNRQWKAATNKYHKEDEMRAMAMIMVARAKQGKESHFSLRGRYIPHEEVRRYWKRKRQTIIAAANAKKEVSYPPELIIYQTMAVGKSPSAPEEFTNTERILWHVRKYTDRRGAESCNLHGYLYFLELPSFTKAWLYTSNQKVMFMLLLFLKTNPSALMIVLSWFSSQFETGSRGTAHGKFLMAVANNQVSELDNSLSAILIGLARCQTNSTFHVINQVFQAYMDTLPEARLRSSYEILLSTLTRSRATQSIVSFKPEMDCIEAREEDRSISTLHLMAKGYHELGNYERARQIALELVEATDMRPIRDPTTLDFFHMLSIMSLKDAQYNDEVKKAAILTMQLVYEIARELLKGKGFIDDYYKVSWMTKGQKVQLAIPIETDDDRVVALLGMRDVWLAMEKMKYTPEAELLIDENARYWLNILRSGELVPIG